ncbi:response regulator [Massilia sp. CCM 8695]|uniref:Response regulator n=1 Tax=Massilia frigida TaxID=2609281 RepID=A0ABX0NH43_9BURK|nr:response regulator [Massilia frigida]
MRDRTEDQKVYTVQPQTIATSPTPSATERPRILIVDDNADAADTLGTYLQLSGYAVTIATDPYAALKLARELRPQVCVLDIGLPGMNGNVLAENLRRLPDTSGAVLIALTGYGQAYDKQRSLGAGFDHYFVKPVNPGTIKDLIDRMP